MKRLWSVIGFVYGLLFTLTAGAEEPTGQAVDTAAQHRDDYITASLLIVGPSSEVYSLFGHCALRLQCPSQQMDYCFTFETATDTWGKLRFFRGNAIGGLMPAPTPDYLAYYAAAGRSVTAYDLNLMPTEKLHLWQRTDEMVARGFGFNYGYMHTQCTSMLIKLITSVLTTPVNYQELPRQLQGSFRDQMLAESAAYPWSRFFWQSIMGSAGDDTGPLEHKITPRLLPVVWQQALMGTDRKLIAGEGTTLVDAADAESASCLFSPTLLFALLLLVAMLITLLGLKGWCTRAVGTFDAVLLVAHTIISLCLTWLTLFSQQEATAWNQYVVVFNPLPLLLWMVLPRWRRTVCLAYLAVMVLFLLCSPCIPQADVPHSLLVATFALRVAGRGLLAKDPQMQNDN